MRKICFITGSRAEYGLLSPIIRLVDESPDCRLQIIATNMHLMPECGNTYREIERDGFTIDCKVPMRKLSDDATGVVASMAEEMRGMNEALDALSPDLVVILGDRYEMLVAATVAMMHRIPIAHIHGGEVTEGAYDDAIRHAITKMSCLHFTSTDEYRRRVVQLGEDPARVFCTGAVGVENILKIEPVGKAELEEFLGLHIAPLMVLATYHPETLGDSDSTRAIGDFLAALDSRPDVQVIFTMPNSDDGADPIRRAIKAYCATNADRCHCFDSLGMRRYLSLMRHAAAVIGNSSSGIIEAPSAHIPTLNVGDRQKGRARGESVLDCADDRRSIVEGLDTVLSDSFRAMARRSVNPYEGRDTARRIFEVISTYPLADITRKKFHDM